MNYLNVIQPFEAVQVDGKLVDRYDVPVFIDTALELVSGLLLKALSPIEVTLSGIITEVSLFT